MSSRTWSHVLLAVVAAHLVFAIARLPHAAFAKRWQEVRRWRETSPVRYFFDGSDAAALEWLLQHTPPNAAVLWRGSSQGALELVPGLLFPRVLVFEPAVQPGAGEALGRPLAHGRLPSGGTDEEGVFLLVSDGEHLELTLR